MKSSLVLAAWLGFIPAALATATSVSHKTHSGVYSLSFEPTKIPTDTIRKIIRLNPTSGHETYQTNIETCVEGDPAYAICGSRDLNAPNFAKNAYANTQKARANLAELFHDDWPKELKPVVNYFKEIANFDVLTASAEYNFVQMWHMAALRSAQVDLDLTKACPKVLAKIKATKSKPAQYKLMHGNWKTCLHDAFATKQPSYPLEAWKGFLATYGVSETFREEPID